MTLLRRLLSAPCALLLAGTLAACETQLDPFVESDMAFSVFGYLDTEADTQFIRVTPLRKTLANDPAPLGVTVTLYHPATGRTEALRDSLFTFANGLVAHNYWSTLPVRPGETYHLTLRDSLGRTATTTARVPPDFPDPEITDDLYTFTKWVTIRGVSRVVTATVRYHVHFLATGQREVVEVDYLERVSKVTEGHVFQINVPEDHSAIGARAHSVIAVERTEVVVGAAGPEWPDLAGLDPETVALPTTIDHVENGLGFVGGVITRRVWF